MISLPLFGALDQWFMQGSQQAGPGIVLCRRGCSACCHGPFDISPAEAASVAAAVTSLEPDRRKHAQQRALAQVNRYVEYAPEWTEPWDIDAIGDDRFDQVSDRMAGAPCPVLSDDGACMIYDDRPSVCRMIGLPMATVKGETLENECPIVHTSAAYASVAPVPFDLAAFETGLDRVDHGARTAGWVRTTVGGAIVTSPTAPDPARGGDSRR